MHSSHRSLLLRRGTLTTAALAVCASLVTPLRATLGDNTRSVTFTVAASNSSADSQAEADYLCTGTNDQTQIQAALNALPANGGRVVLLEGTYNISGTIRIEKDSTTLEGQGTGQRAGVTQTGIGTKLLAASGLTGSLLQVQTAANTRPVYGVILQHFTVDGGSPSVGSAVDGILYRSNGGKISQVHVHNMSGSGIRVQGYASWDTYDTHLTHVHSSNNADAGVLFDTGAADTHLISSVIFNNNDNVRLKAGSVQISSNHFYNATRYNVHFDNAGARTKLVGNKIEGAGDHGIYIVHNSSSPSDVQIVGNGFRNNGDSGVGVADHISTSGSSSMGRITIVANNFGADLTNRTRHAIKLDAQMTNANVQSNNIQSGHNLAPFINANGASGQFRNNVGFATESQGTATVASGATSIVVSHGLAVTPALKNIVVTPTNSLGSATKFWISSPTSSNFTINVDANPGATTATFVWTAAVQ